MVGGPEPHLAGRTCYVMEDNDEPGAAHVRKVAEHLAGVAAEVRIVRLPGLAPKGDVEDWITAGGDAATLLDLCRAAPVFDPGAAENTAPARQAKRRDANDTRPVVTILAGQIKDAVDAIESALIRARRPVPARQPDRVPWRGAGHHRRQAGGQRHADLRARRARLGRGHRRGGLPDEVGRPGRGLRRHQPALVVGADAATADRRFPLPDPHRRHQRPDAPA